jgi:hypothetical protein
LQQQQPAQTVLLVALVRMVPQRLAALLLLGLLP